MSQSSYNVANQLTSRSSSGGSMMFAGVLDKQGTVTVAGNPAAVNHFTTNFVGYANVTSGTNVVQIIATDYNGNSRTNNYQLVVTNNGVAETITYDLNGNETSVVTITSTSVYQWDAANRLVSIIGPTNQSLFTYDGLGRQVQDIELQNGMAVSTNTFLWDGQTLAEQRDNTRTNVVKRFFGEGEQISGTSYFFTRDHLGSIREMTDAAGTIRARYDYDPYGRRMKIQGDLDADFGYAGMYYHTASGLLLTFYRAYDSDLGRWMSRDPLEEAAGLNLYTYVANNPVRFIDPLGNDIGIYGGGTGDQNNPYLFIPQPSTTSPSLGLNLGLGGGGYYFVGAEGTISTCRCCENGKKYRVSVLTVCSGIGFDMKFKGKLPKIAKPSPPIPGSVSSGESSCPPPVKYYLKSAIDLGPLEIATSGTSLNISAGLGIRILLFCSDTVISKQPVQ
jgi:RHS repeat-associated protein